LGTKVLPKPCAWLSFAYYEDIQVFLSKDYLKVYFVIQAWFLGVVDRGVMSKMRW